MKNQLKSEIQGNANIIYGGKIGGAISRLERDEPNVIIRIGELQEINIIGQIEKDRKYKDGYQVNMVFNNLESIDAVMNWLEVARENLRNQLEWKA